MPEIGIRLDIANMPRVTKKLREFGASLDDMEQLYDDLAQIMVEHEHQWFASEGRGSWPPLATSTQVWKFQHGYPLDPMVRTGDLLESLTDPERAMRIEQGRSSLGTFTSKSFSWGTEITNDRGDPYPRYHQEAPVGENTGGGQLPIRNVIEVTPDLEEKVRREIADFISRERREAGL
jgi:hypothetical protein